MPYSTTSSNFKYFAYGVLIPVFISLLTTRWDFL